MSRLSSLRLLPVLVLLLASAAATGQTVWRSGSTVYTPLYDQLGNYQSNGTGYFVSQATVANPPQPQVGQVYYLSVYMVGIASPQVGRLMHVYLQLPSGTSVVADPAIPVRCFYRPMDGSNAWYDFTIQVLTDTSFGGSLRIAGCPQPSSAALPARTLTDGSGGSGLLLTRRDPQNPSAEAWPMGSYAGYEFLVPVVSDRVMDGFSSNNIFRTPIYSMQGDIPFLWAYPQLALRVHPAPAQPSADMSITQLHSITPLLQGNRRMLARCSNLGPDAAVNATCAFTLLPAGASLSCTPAGVQASLPAGSDIECVSEFPIPPGGHTVEVTAGSSTADPNPQNNGIGMNFQPGSGQPIEVFRSDFEG